MFKCSEYYLNTFVAGEDEEEVGGTHEVFSYKLTRVGDAAPGQRGTGPGVAFGTSTNIAGGVKLASFYYAY